MGRITTLLELVAFLLIAIGVGWIFRPAGLITAGVEILAGSYFATRPPKANR